MLVINKYVFLYNRWFLTFVSVCIALNGFINFSALSVPDNSGITKLKIYPNPTSNFINIDFEENFSFSAKLYDIYGKLMSSQISVNKINIGDFSDGIYLLEIRDLKSNQKRIEKIIVVHYKSCN